MTIEHVALWCRDLEAVAAFYTHWFGAVPGPRYENPAKGFASRFLSFDGGARLELMSRRDGLTQAAPQPAAGWAHAALIVGDEAAVDALTRRMAAAGIPVLDGPRRTGDGYYESVVLDPEGNRIELCAQKEPPMPERPRFESVDAYFAALEAGTLAAASPAFAWMRELRRRIPEWVPGAVEVISYQMPAFRRRKVFVFYAPFARHLGVYPPVGGDEALQRDLAPYRGPKGNLQFPYKQPLPWDLIERVVKALAEELGG